MAGGFFAFDGDVDAPDMIDPLVKLCKDPRTKPVVFLCDDSEHGNAAQALVLREALDTHLKTFDKAKQRWDYDRPHYYVDICPHIREKRVLFEELSGRQGIVPFGQAMRPSLIDAIVNSDITRLASAFRLNFDSNFASVPLPPPGLEDRAWKLRSNTLAARHSLAKLAALEFRRVPRSSRVAVMKEVSEAELQLLARIEHNRYLGARLVAGWGFGRSESPENYRRLSFVDWDNLEDYEISKDYNQVRELFAYYQPTEHEENASVRSEHFKLARSTVRVGVTGHRDLVTGELPQLEQRVAAQLESLGRGATRKILVSSLAAGADQLVAQVALRTGWTLRAILPVPAEHFRKDFAGDAKALTDFNALLASADSAKVARPDSTRPDAGYAAAADLVLDESDVLLCLWDGKPTTSDAGTDATRRAAQKRAKPTEIITVGRSGRR